MIFKSRRLFDPVKVKEMPPDAAAVDTLRCVPFFDADNRCGRDKCAGMVELA